MPGSKRPSPTAAWIHSRRERQTPEAAAALLKSEMKLWGDVIHANNITAQ